VLVEARDVSKQKEAEYMLDSYSQMVERNTRDLQREKERVEKLLLNIMPRSVFDEMTQFGTVTPQRFDDATILMLDFVQFTSMAISRDPGALVAELNDIFTAFDRIVELFGGERLKTIGDAYLAVAGLPDPSPTTPTTSPGWRCGSALPRAPQRLPPRAVAVPHRPQHRPGHRLDRRRAEVRLRHLRSRREPRRRLESLAEPMQIVVSEPTYRADRQRLRVHRPRGGRGQGVRCRSGCTRSTARTQRR
jgi:class 3 adenylate cyclase